MHRHLRARFFERFFKRRNGASRAGSDKAERGCAVKPHPVVGIGQQRRHVVHHRRVDARGLVELRGDALEAGEQHEKTLTIQYRAIHRDGHIFWREDYLTLLYEETGKLQTVYVLARDITERRQLEDALRESEAKRRGLTPIAKIVATSSHAQAPAWFTTAPISKPPFDPP